MDAKELRIGNWVQANDGKAYLVSASTINGINHLTGKWNIQINPIPLTEEWLIRFGLKKIDKYTFSKKGWFIYKRKRGFVTGSKSRETKLESVHQLQNWWFGNTGEELIYNERKRGN